MSKDVVVVQSRRGRTVFSTKLVTTERQVHSLVAKATGSVHPISRKPILAPALAGRRALKVVQTV
jgi:hypothetical protein